MIKILGSSRAGAKPFIYIGNDQTKKHVINKLIIKLLKRPGSETNEKLIRHNRKEKKWEVRDFGGSLGSATNGRPHTNVSILQFLPSSTEISVVALPTSRSCCELQRRYYL